MNDKLQEIQLEYLNLLKAKISESDIDTFELLDFLQLFWFKNRNIINLASEYLFKGENIPVYTAATTLNMNNSDNFIFFLVGEYRIFDDPIPPYVDRLSSTIQKRILDENIASKLQTIIRTTISNEIELLENVDDIYIFPLRYIQNFDRENHLSQLNIISKEFINQFFTKDVGLNILKDEHSINQLVIEDRIKNIKLFETDNPSNPIEKRVKELIKETQDLIPENLNDIQKLYFLLNGYFIQALEIMNMCQFFNVVPFITSATSFSIFAHLITILLVNMQDKDAKNVEFIDYFENLLSQTSKNYFTYIEYCNSNQDLSLSNLISKGISINFSNEIKKIRYSVNNVQESNLSIKVIIDKLVSE